MTLQAQTEPTYLQSLQYRVEEVIRPRGSGNSRPGRRPDRRPGKKGSRYRDRGGRHTFPLGPGEYPMPDIPRRDPELVDEANKRPGRNNRRDHDRGGKHTFPLGPGEYPMPNIPRREPDLADADSVSA